MHACILILHDDLYLEFVGVILFPSAIYISLSNTNFCCIPFRDIMSLYFCFVLFSLLVAFFNPHVKLQL